jgi:hypothetical protein
MKFLKSFAGNTLRDHKTKEEIREKLNIFNLKVPESEASGHTICQEQISHPFSK